MCSVIGLFKLTNWWSAPKILTPFSAMWDMGSPDAGDRAYNLGPYVGIDGKRWEQNYTLAWLPILILCIFLHFRFVCRGNCTLSLCQCRLSQPSKPVTTSIYISIKLFRPRLQKQKHGSHLNGFIFSFCTIDKPVCPYKHLGLLIAQGSNLCG